MPFRPLVVAVALAGACSSSPDVPPPSRLDGETITGFIDSGDARLSYRLDLPARTGDVPAVVIGHGSGRVTKDECRSLADRFLARRVATLCYDKRGVGQSSGQYAMVGTANSVPMFDQLSGDMAAAARFLRTRPGVDRERVGLVGASQAGWIIPLAAASVRPAFMILLVGPTVSVGEEIFYSRLIEETSRPPAEGYAELPGFRGERGFDPVGVLETLDVPGLWLLGAEDRSIPTPATVAILDRLKQSGRPFAHVVFEGFGHNLSAAAIWPEIDRWLAETLGAGR